MATPVGAPGADDGLRVLVVEDNKVNQLYAFKMLSKAGHAVDIADNGREALEAVHDQHYDIILMDISTVSRVVNGKYVQSDFGVYELKYFFSEGLTTESGEDVSNKEVKAIIESIIEKEDKTKPLSDQKIAQLLEGQGFQIARRTVTKYREQLNIPVARLRKEIVLN